MFLVRQSFFRQVDLVGKVEFGLYQVLQVALISIGKDLVALHPDPLAQLCFFTKLIFHFVGDSALFKFWLVKIFLVIAKVFVVSTILARWVWCSLSINKAGVR